MKPSRQHQRGENWYLQRHHEVRSRVVLPVKQHYRVYHQAPPPSRHHHQGGQREYRSYSPLQLHIGYRIVL